MPIHFPKSFPTAKEEMLLKLLLGESRDLAKDFEEWVREVPFDDIDYATMGLLPMLYLELHEKIDHPLLKKIEGLYRLAWVKNQLLLKEVAPVLKEFSNAGIDVILLKGAALFLTAYKSPGARFVEDVDILIKDADLEKVSAILYAAGWMSPMVPTESAPTHHSRREFPFTKDGKRIDLHCVLFSPDEMLSSWELLTIQGTGHPMGYAALRERAQKVYLHEVPVWVPSPEDMMLHIIAHGAPLNVLRPFRWVIDAISIMRTSTIDWECVLARTTQFDLIPEMQYAFAYLRKTFSFKEIPEDFYQKLFALRAPRAHTHYYLMQANGKRSLFGNVLLAWYRYRVLDPLGRTSPGFFSFTEFLRKNWGLTKKRDIPLFLLKRTYQRLREHTAL